MKSSLRFGIRCFVWVISLIHCSGQDSPVWTPPTPAMTLLSAMPTQGSTAGGIPVTLQVSNLGQNPKVMFNGLSAPVQQVTADGQLVVTLPKALGAFGPATIQIIDDQGRVAVNQQLFSYYSSLIGFEEKQTIDVGVQPVNIASADLNGDQLTDLVIANASPEATSTNPSIAVLLGRADGTFRSMPAIQLTSSPNYPSGLSLADFNNDGKIDLAFTVYDKGAGKGKLGLLWGNGDGTFQLQNVALVEVGLKPYSLISRDFNNDGQRALVVVNLGPADGSAPGSISIFTVAPGGILTKLQDLPGDTYPFYAAAADFNEDGKLDIAVPMNYSGHVRLYLNQTMPGMPLSFQSTGLTDLTVGKNPTSVVATDLNGDGRPDLATANYGTNNITVLINMGQGNFAPALSFPLTLDTLLQNPFDLTVADINGDQIPDLLVANNWGQSIGLLQGIATPDLFLPIQKFSTSYSPRAVATGDFNGDQKTDVVVASYFGGTLSVLLNQSF